MAGGQAHGSLNRSVLRGAVEILGHAGKFLNPLLSTTALSFAAACGGGFQYALS
jgi:hypothetical protein